MREIRKTVLPKDVFDLIEGYMFGDIKTLHIIAVTKSDKVLRVSTGVVPEFFAANDSSSEEIARALS